MDKQHLIETVAKLVEFPKGILAIDESTETCTKRFEALGVASNEDTRRAYRELIITTPGIEQYISGMILVDETIKQKTAGDVPFFKLMKKHGIEVGIKVDGGLEDFAGHPGEKVTKGLEGLDDRLSEYKNWGASFAKWRAVYSIGGGLPSNDCVHENSMRHAEYALLCQEAGIVPIVEPEVLMDGNHNIEDSYDATARVLRTLFTHLSEKGVFFPGLILKTSMVLPGSLSNDKSSPKEIALHTIKCFKENVPEGIGGIVFLSGGQSEESATVNLKEMHAHGALPWPLTFSYGRAIQNSALHIWAKDQNNITQAQQALLERARADSDALTPENK